MPLSFTAAPTLPSLSDPANFNDRALSLFSWMTQTFIAELEGMTTSDLLQLLPNGSAGAPALAFSSDSDTGMYRVGANQIGFSVGGAKVLDIASSGITAAGYTTLTSLTAFDAGGSAAGGAKGVLQMIPVAQTAAIGLLGTGISFGRPDGSGRRKAAIFSIQTGSDANQTGLVIATYSGTTTTTDQVISKLLVDHSGTMYLANSDHFAGANLGSFPSPGGYLMFHRNNILGTVSQSGGVPTGGIIERGSNANGEYVRYADGTQICWRTANVDVTTTSNQAFNYPANFSAVPAIAWTQMSASLNAALQTANIKYVRPAASEWGVGLVSAGTSSSPGTVTEQLRFTAIGRWF